METSGNATWLTAFECGDLVVDNFSDGASGPDARASLQRGSLSLPAPSVLQSASFGAIRTCSMTFLSTQLHAAFGRGHFPPAGTRRSRYHFSGREAGETRPFVQTTFTVSPSPTLPFSFEVSATGRWWIQRLFFSPSFRSDGGRAYFRSRLDPSGGLTFSLRGSASSPVLEMSFLCSSSGGIKLMTFRDSTSIHRRIPVPV